jgi:hypothetical protein
MTSGGCAAGPKPIAKSRRRSAARKDKELGPTAGKRKKPRATAANRNEKPTRRAAHFVTAADDSRTSAARTKSGVEAKATWNKLATRARTRAAVFGVNRAVLRFELSCRHFRDKIVHLFVKQVTRKKPASHRRRAAAARASLPSRDGAERAVGRQKPSTGQAAKSRLSDP